MSPRALILAIEITNPSSGAGCGVALRDAAAGWVDVEPLRPPRTHPPGAARAGHGGHDDDLMPAIDRLFRRRESVPRDIALVMVSVGPGGYTSLRIACAAGKLIAEGAGAARGIPVRCVAVPTALVVARRVDAAAWSRGGVAIALASKGQSAWVQRVEHGAHTPGLPPPAGHAGLIDATGLPALQAAGVRTLVADRFLPDPMRTAAADLGIHIVEPVFDPGALFEIPVGDRGLPTLDPVDLVPLYPREPDAVTIWRARQTRV